MTCPPADLTDPLPQAHGKLVAICRDPVQGSLWSAAERAVYKYRVVDETRDVWQVGAASPTVPALLAGSGRLGMCLLRYDEFGCCRCGQIHFQIWSRM